ncbi:MAG: hypothetical protein ACFE75_03585 [Candidatus Hodarchaeota archaeon]
MASEEENKGKLSEEEAEKIREELSEIKENLKEEMDELYEGLTDKIEDIKDKAEDIRDDMKDDLESIEEERKDLLDEIEELKRELEGLGGDTRKHINNFKNKVIRHRKNAEEQLEEFAEKLEKKLKKAKEKVKRINISVDPEMSDEWRDWADNLGASVSELVRKSMKFVKNNIGDLRKLEEWGKKMEKMGEGIEQAVKDSGIEELGEKLEKDFGKKKRKAEIKMAIIQDSDKNRIKKRVSGLIKLHKSLPIDKLAQALNKSKEDAENLVYEIVADGIEGSLEEGVFKFTSTSMEVISKLNELIDKM